LRMIRHHAVFLTKWKTRVKRAKLDDWVNARAVSAHSQRLWK
jgi:hypothetical protein